ncbi:hypothetical protein TIFTF001_029862 [Ficus carica]|uniref:J domain-containing protein n=1 Tax=Ficus carica TaxID=3494 RepID=A0AA88DT54_FICCA|nr:hypothetical protein TIFTF001_029862 [Ficus carica]
MPTKHSSTGKCEREKWNRTPSEWRLSDYWDSLRSVCRTKLALQCCRLAFLFHPNKNKFAFTNQAFKLVAQVWSIFFNSIKKRSTTRNSTSSPRSTSPPSPLPPKLLLFSAIKCDVVGFQGSKPSRETD